MGALTESVGVEGGGARGKNRRTNWEILQGSRLLGQPGSPGLYPQGQYWQVQAIRNTDPEGSGGPDGDVVDTGTDI